VRNFCLAEYPGAKYIDADDIAGTQVSDKSQQSSRQILNALGIYPQARKQEINEGAQIIRQKLPMRVDGKPGLLVNLIETDIIDGFKGGLHYPEVKEGKEQEVYEKDGYFEHCFDAGRYIATQMFTVIGQTEMTNEIVQNSLLEHQWRDGRPRASLDPNEVANDYGGLSDALGADMGGEIL
jgi:hypothetical protein